MTKENNKNIAQAIGKSLKTSPQKANLVLRSIRGKKAEDALNSLTFSRKRISEQVSKILKSAISNAENNHQLDIDNLYVKEASVGKSMVLKRFRPRARGRSGKILKPFSRVRILVEEKKDSKVKQKPESSKNEKQSNEDKK
jgi:large subunit ribosomal protein L22